MKPATGRLYFIDAMRAWAILMMLQGHFIDGLLDNAFRDDQATAYVVWKYFRGITAPVFFTVSGFIFTYLLTRVDLHGFKNPRIKKGVKRGLQLVVIGYLLRLNLGGLILGKLYPSFFLVDVLHCIGISLLLIILIYLLTYRQLQWLFPTALLLLTLGLFLLEPQYKELSHSYLPNALANYLTKINGSVFTIIPWAGYACFGAFVSTLFMRYREAQRLYLWAIILCLVLGYALHFESSAFLSWFGNSTHWQFLHDVVANNYLFIRLGDVLLVFAVFMLVQRFLKHKTFLEIGQNTLSIYVIHFIILYGSFTGQGLYRYFNHSLTPWQAISGALAFMIACTALALGYERCKSKLWAPVDQFLDRLSSRFGK